MSNKSAQPSEREAVANINMTKCQYQQCKRVLKERVERIKQNRNQIKSTHISRPVASLLSSTLPNFICQFLRNY